MKKSVLYGAIAMVLAIPIIPASVHTADAASAFCSLTGLTKYQWTGNASNAWDNPNNWSPNQVPGTTPGGGSDYVCLNNAGAITMTTNRAELVAFDMRGTTLTMLTNSQLFVYGNQSTQPSTIRKGATVLMTGSNTIGGVGRIDDFGTLRMNSVGGVANTIATRICAIGGTCSGPVVGTKGLLNVGDQGVLRINGADPVANNLGGINFKDQYQIEVTGTVEIANKGFISADYGTSMTLLPKIGGVGTLNIKNNGGYYEGSQFFGLPALSTLTNNGLILKSGGAGTSVITATYSAPSGSVTVNVGTLVLPEGPVTPATVAAGKAIGSGECQSGGSTLACQPIASNTDVQTTLVRLSPDDTGGATVAFQELGAKADPSDVATPVQIDTVGLQATPTSPAILSLRYDTSVLGGQHVADLQIFRKEGAGAYTQVMDCLSNGNPPTGQTSCVDRRGIANVSSRNLGDGDALIIIRTQGTSRWVAR